jgi:5-hydroxyisourate hydrolase
MTSVSTHVLDTTAGRPAEGVAVELSLRPRAGAPWTPHAASRTDADGRCTDLPALPRGAAHARLRFAVEPYLAGLADRAGAAGLAGGPPFFPEVTVVFAVRPGEHHHVPLLLSPFGYSVYRGS